MNDDLRPSHSSECRNEYKLLRRHFVLIPPETTFRLSDMADQKMTTREAMVSYWQFYKPTLESMMLDSNASTLTAEEVREVLSYVPDYSGKNVLELGAGIGRFTGSLAQRANRVMAVDFMDDFVEKNRQTNGHHPNVEFVRADVTRFDQPSNSYDLIFSNWLLMYLNEEEVSQLVTKMLSWLTDDGVLFLRESCFHPSGHGVARPQTNPTFYRDPTFYSHVLQVAKGTSCFQLVRATSLNTYVKFKNNPNQLCYSFRKVHSKITSSLEGPAANYQNFQQFLDDNQYTRKGILVYESIFGNNFVSTGGLETTVEFCELLDLKAGDRVLDVGCGIGGSAFHMAKTYHANVRGVDLSANMISIALERQIKEVASNKVCFEICDITDQDYPQDSFDVIYSRDTLLHISNKQKLFSSFLKWLKPGGRLLVTDYCRGVSGTHSDRFERYVAQRGYHLLTVAEYGKLLQGAGFNSVRADDRTGHFVSILRTELKRFEEEKTNVLKTFSEKDYEYITSGWRAKIERCADGDQAWGLFTAFK